MAQARGEAVGFCTQRLRGPHNGGRGGHVVGLYQFFALLLQVVS